MKEPNTTSRQQSPTSKLTHADITHDNTHVHPSVSEQVNRKCLRQQHQCKQPNNVQYLNGWIKLQAAS